MMDASAEITGDYSPIHIQEDYAKGRGYPSRVCHGMLVGSMLSTLAGVYLPGEHCLLHGVDVKFAKPVFSGDVLQVTGRVAELHEAFKLVILKVTITNQKSEKVCRGRIQLGVSK